MPLATNERAPAMTAHAAIARIPGSECRSPRGLRRTMPDVDAPTGVVHQNVQQWTLTAFAVDVDAATRVVVFDGVGQEVEEHLSWPPAIGGD